VFSLYAETGSRKNTAAEHQQHVRPAGHRVTQATQEETHGISWEGGAELTYT